MAKGLKQIEEDAERKRKAGVNAVNKKKAQTEAAKESELANTPLTKLEREYIARIAPRLKEGRNSAQPSPAEILRYSKLIKRKDVK